MHTIAFLVNLLACGGTALPEKRPDDFAVYVSESGGMMPISTDMSCAPAGCEYRHFENGQETKQSGKPTPEQLDELYAVVRDHRFDRIRMEKHGTIYDSGGTSVSVYAGGESWSFGASANESVAESSQEDFRAVVGAVGKICRDLGLTTPKPEPKATPEPAATVEPAPSTPPEPAPKQQ